MADGIGNGYYGFSIPTPAALQDGQAHTITVAIGSPAYLLNSSLNTTFSCKGGRVTTINEGGCAGSYEITFSAIPTYNGQTYSTNDVSGFYMTTPGDTLSTYATGVVSRYLTNSTFSATVGYKSPVNSGSFNPLTDPAPAGNSLFNSGNISNGFAQNMTFNTSGRDAGSQNGAATQGNYYFGGRATLNTCRGTYGPIATVGFAVHVTAAPVVSSISPSSIPAGVPTRMTATGTGFGQAATLEFSVPSNFTVSNVSSSATQAVADVTPQAAGTYTVDVKETRDVAGFAYGQPGAKGETPKSATKEVEVVTGGRIYFTTSGRVPGTCDSDITNQTVSVIVGQQINLCAKDDAGTPLRSATWTVPGYLVAGYAPSLSAAVGPTNADLSAVAPTFYWASGNATYAVMMGGTTQSGTPVGAKATFMVAAPIGALSATSLGPPGVTIGNAGDPGCGFAFPNFCVHYGGQGSPALTFSHSFTVPSGFSGQFLWVQTVKTGVSRTDPSGITSFSGCASSFVLDTTYPYDTNNPTTDSPRNALLGGYVERTRSDDFVMTLMFQPPSSSGGIPVPLANLYWSWSYDALATGTGWIFASQPLATSTFYPGSTTLFPAWDSNSRTCIPDTFGSAQ